MPDRLADKYELRNYTRLEVQGRVFRFVGFPDDAVDPNGAYTRATVEALEAVDEARVERERIQEDERLSPAGRRETILERLDELASPEENENLGRIQTYRKQLRRKIERFRQELEEDGPPSPESPVEVHKDAEMRLYLRQEKDGPGRQRFLREAVRDGRSDVIRAALDGAPELAGLTPEQQAELREKAIRHRNPDLVEKIEAHEAALSHMDRTVDTVEGAIRAIASQPVSEPEGSAA